MVVETWSLREQVKGWADFIAFLQRLAGFDVGRWNTVATPRGHSPRPAEPLSPSSGASRHLLPV